MLQKRADFRILHFHPQLLVTGQENMYDLPMVVQDTAGIFHFIRQRKNKAQYSEKKDKRKSGQEDPGKKTGKGFFNDRSFFLREKRAYEKFTKPHIL